MPRLRNLLRGRGDRLERDLERELRYHMDRRVEDLMHDGLDEAEARRRASMELGGIPQVQEAVRDTWRSRSLDAFLRDLRDAKRSLTRSPGFALGAGAILTLALGANLAMFSVVSAVLLQPLPYPDPDRLVSIETLWTNTGQAIQEMSGPDFVDLQAQNAVFEKVAAHYGSSNTPVVVGDRAVFANDQFVSADFFAVLGQAPSRGRLLTVEDVPAGGALPATAVVAHSWAVAHFGSAEAALGRTIVDYGTALEIVGVASQGFHYPGKTDIWASWHVGADGPRDLHDYRVVGRLRPGIDLTRAGTETRGIGDRLAAQHEANRLKTLTLVPLQERLTGSLRATLWALMAAVGIVWLLASANVANLQLARATERTREIALRAALGAGRGRVVRQLVTESAMLAAAAGLAGLLLSWMLLNGAIALSPADLPRIDEVQLNASVVVFALALSFLSTMVFGLVPALDVSRLDLADALKQGGAKATASRTGVRLRSGLVVAEVALSVILLATSSLLAGSFRALQRVDLGFTTDRVLVAYTEYAVRDDNAEDLRTRSRFYADVLDRLRTVPGVSAAAGVAYLGMGREPRAPRDYFVQGRPEGVPGERPQAEFHAVTPDYFRTLEIPVLSGRDFAEADTPERPRVAIVNETLARTAFPDESPIGKHVRTGTSSRAPWMEIVGVVGDARWQDPGQPARPVIFAASTQGVGNSLSILARTSLDEASLAGTLRRILNETDPTVPVELDTLEEMFAFALRYPRFRTEIVGLFAAVAAVLAAVGMFSVLAYLVGQRTRELAIRRALGASAVHVTRLIAGQGLRLVAGGLVLGLAGALAVAPLLTSFLYEIGPWDARAYLWTIGVIGAAALLAILLPAMRAATIAPAVVLQQE